MSSGKKKSQKLAKSAKIKEICNKPNLNRAAKSQKTERNWHSQNERNRQKKVREIGKKSQLKRNWQSKLILLIAYLTLRVPLTRITLLLL